MTLGLLGALVTALAYGVATVLQSVGSGQVAAVDGFDPRLLVRLSRSLPYVTGLALDAVGFLAGVLALRTLPLFLVQAAVASSVGVTALVASRWLAVRLGGREVVGLWALGGGLVLLAVSARPEAATALSGPGQWVVLAGLAPLLLLIAVAGRWTPARAGVALSAAAGLGFGGVGIAARALQVPAVAWHLVTSPLAWALACYGIVAIYCYAAALQRGRVTVVAAITFVVETVVPALIGLLLLGDRARPGFAPVAAAGFVTTVAAALVLARLAEVPETGQPDIGQPDTGQRRP